MNVESTIRIVIADDHALVRGGVKSVLQLESDFLVVGEAASSDEAIDCIRTLSPDIVVIDQYMPPGLDGAETTRRAIAHDPSLKIIVISFDDHVMKLAFDAGAKGFIAKRSAFEELPDAIRAVNTGKMYVGKSVKLAEDQAWTSTSLEKLT